MDLLLAIIMYVYIYVKDIHIVYSGISGGISSGIYSGIYDISG